VAGSELGMKRGYLLWDPGFGGRFAASLVTLLFSTALAAAVPALQVRVWEAYQEALFLLMEGANAMAWWSVIGLLSSSCCALQLLLNAVNFGCAGFNTVLGPLRPALCAGTVCIQGAVWYTAWDKPFQWLYVAPCTATAAVLTLLPELTFLWVQRGAGKPLQARLASQLVLELGGMGCVACTKKITEVLAEDPRILCREVSLERKEAVLGLNIDPATARTELAPELIGRIKAAGFEASLRRCGLVEAISESKCESPEGLGASGGACCSAGLPPAALGGGAGGLPLAAATGLLSSSCCLIQLGANLLAALNVVHVGCTGLNKILGPWRPQLRLLTAAWLCTSWSVCARQRWRRPTVLRLSLQTTLCLVLMFLPEALVWAGGPALAPPTQGAEVIKVKVDGMGCEACQAHVQGVMGRSGGVVSSHVDWQTGHAEIVVNKEWAFDFAKMATRLQDDGYEAKLQSEL